MLGKRKVVRGMVGGPYSAPIFPALWEDERMPDSSLAAPDASNQPSVSDVVVGDLAPTAEEIAASR